MISPVFGISNNCFIINLYSFTSKLCTYISVLVAIILLVEIVVVINLGV